MVAYKVVGTYEVFSTQHERKEVGHESPAYESRQRGVRTVAGIESGLHMNTSMNSRWSAMVVCKLKVSLLLHP